MNYVKINADVDLRYHNSDSHNSTDSHDVRNSHNTNEQIDNRQYSNMNNQTTSARDVTIARDGSNVFQNFGTLIANQSGNASS